jgi:hypothetical protein
MQSCHIYFRDTSIYITPQSEQEGVSMPDNLNTVTKGFLQFVGFKSWNAFAKGALSLGVHRNGEEIEITPYASAYRGAFIPIPDKTVKCQPQAKEVGQKILEQLTLCS